MKNQQLKSEVRVRYKSSEKAIKANEAQAKDAKKRRAPALIGSPDNC